MKDNDRPSNRTIVRVLLLITLYAVLLFVLYEARTILVWLGVAGFLALAFNPAVNRLARYMPRRNRGLAVTAVIGCVILFLALLAFIFIPPLVSQTQNLISHLPQFSNFFQQSNNPIAKEARHYDLIPLIKSNQSKVTGALTNISGSAVDVVRTLFKSIAATLTILVLSVFMLLEGPNWARRLKQADKTGRVKQHTEILEKMGATISGYVNGNLLTSLIAAIATAIFLTILHVPYALPLGLLVGLFDLIPLVGATLGAIVVISVALVHSLAAGIAVLIFYVIYQQLENHILQPMIYSRMVQLSPFLVLVSALAGAELGGLLGALVAIPIAADIQILARELWLRRQNPEV